MSAPTREQILRDVIALALHLIDAADAKQLPVDRYTFRVSHSIGGDNDEQGMNELARIADVLGVQITNAAGKPAGDDDDHFYARKMFGLVEYEAYYIPHQVMTDYSAFMATRKAWQAAQVADVPVPATAPDADTRDPWGNADCTCKSPDRPHYRGTAGCIVAPAVEQDPDVLDQLAVAATDPAEVDRG